jgi:uncharacterized protein (TIGR02266 family)
MLILVTVTDKRKKERKIVLITAYCRSQDGMKIGHTLDISEGGMFLKTNDFFSVGEELFIEFEIPDEKQTLKAKGKVVWATPVSQREVKPDLPGCGIEFTSIDSTTLDRLNGYVKKVTGETIYTDDW